MVATAMQRARLSATTSLWRTSCNGKELRGKRCWQMKGLGLASCGDLLDVIRPTLERSAHLVGVFGSLVYTSHPRAMSAVVVQDRLDVVRLHAEFAKLRCTTAPKVVEPVRR